MSSLPVAYLPVVLFLARDEVPRRAPAVLRGVDLRPVVLRPVLVLRGGARGRTAGFACPPGRGQDASLSAHCARADGPGADGPGADGRSADGRSAGAPDASDEPRCASCPPCDGACGAHGPARTRSPA